MGGGGEGHEEKVCRNTNISSLETIHEVLVLVYVSGSGEGRTSGSFNVLVDKDGDLCEAGEVVIGKPRSRSITGTGIRACHSAFCGGPWFFSAGLENGNRFALFSIRETSTSK